MTTQLRLVSSRVPYRRAGLAFEGPALVVDLVELDATRFELLLGDPAIDVSLGDDGRWWTPLDTDADFETAPAFLNVIATIETAATIADAIEAADVAELRRENADLTVAIGELEARYNVLVAEIADRDNERIASEAAAAARDEARIALERDRPDDDAPPVDPTQPGDLSAKAVDHLRATFNAAPKPRPPRRRKPKTG